MKLFLVLCVITVVHLNPVRAGVRSKRQFLGGLGSALGGVVGGGSSSQAASHSRGGGAGLSILGIPLVGVGANYNEAAAASQSHNSGLFRVKRQFLGGIGSTLGGLVGGGSNSQAASHSRGGGAGLSILGIPLVGVGANYNQADAASQSHTSGLFRVKRQFLGGIGSTLGGLVGGGSSSNAASHSRGGGAGLSILGIPLVGVGANYNEAAAASQSHTSGLVRVKRQFLGGIGSTLGGLVGGGSSSSAASHSRGGGAGLSILGIPLVGVGANYNEAAAASQSHTSGVFRTKRESLGGESTHGIEHPI